MDQNHGTGGKIHISRTGSIFIENNNAKEPNNSYHAMKNIIPKIPNHQQQNKELQQQLEQLNARHQDLHLTHTTTLAQYRRMEKELNIVREQASFNTNARYSTELRSSTSRSKIQQLENQTKEQENIILELSNEIIALRHELDRLKGDRSTSKKKGKILKTKRSSTTVTIKPTGFGRSYSPDVKESTRTSWHYSPSKPTPSNKSHTTNKPKNRRESTPIANALEVSASISPKAYRKEIIRQVLKLANPTIKSDSNAEDEEEKPTTWTWSVKLAILMGINQEDFPTPNMVNDEYTTNMVLKWWSDMRSISAEAWLTQREHRASTATQSTASLTESILQESINEQQESINEQQEQRKQQEQQKQQKQEQQKQPEQSEPIKKNTTENKLDPTKDRRQSLRVVAVNRCVESKPSTPSIPSKPTPTPYIPVEVEFGASPFMWASKERSERIRRLEKRGIYQNGTRQHIRPPGPAFSVCYNPSTADTGTNAGTDTNTDTIPLPTNERMTSTSNTFKTRKPSVDPKIIDLSTPLLVPLTVLHPPLSTTTTTPPTSMDMKTEDKTFSQVHQEYNARIGVSPIKNQTTTINNQTKEKKKKKKDQPINETDETKETWRTDTMYLGGNASPQWKKKCNDTRSLLKHSIVSKKDIIMNSLYTTDTITNTADNGNFGYTSGTKVPFFVSPSSSSSTQRPVLFSPARVMIDQIEEDQRNVSKDSRYDIDQAIAMARQERQRLQDIRQNIKKDEIMQKNETIRQKMKQDEQMHRQKMKKEEQKQQDIQDVQDVLQHGLKKIEQEEERIEEITAEERRQVIEEWTMQQTIAQEEEKSLVRMQNVKDENKKKENELKLQEINKQLKEEKQQQDETALAAEVAMLEELVIAAEAAAKEKGQLLSYSKKLEQHIDKLEVLAIT